jgi:RNA polymerase sigma-70 factor (ECF subfamily)
VSYEDAAHALNIPVGTVRSRLSRARRRLSELEIAERSEFCTPTCLPSPLEEP